MAIEKCGGTAATPRWFGFALQSLVYLAHRAQNESRCPSGEIAGIVCTEATLMRRILAKLARAGIVEAREGREGGYYLRKPPEAITLAEVYRALELTEPLCAGMMDTADGGRIGPEIKDAFSDLMIETERLMMELLERRTVAELVERTFGEKK